MTREEADEFFNDFCATGEISEYSLSYHDGQFSLKNARGEVPLPDGMTVKSIKADKDGALFAVIQGDGFVVVSDRNGEWFVE